MNLALKQNLRKYYLARCAQLSLSRKSQAAHDLFEMMCPIVSDCKSVLSFYNFKEEINLLLLNEYLAKEGKLLLPRMENDTLRIFQICNLQDDLEQNTLGLFEPKLTCKEILPEQISLILVPGLAFDSYGNRLGYGKGFYDRFLNQTSSEAFGIGYKEQFFEGELPSHLYDYPLDQFFLF